MTKRIVVWGTGFVGKMVIAEVVKHPLFELVGVGMSNPDKVGRDVGEICGRPARILFLACGRSPVCAPFRQIPPWGIVEVPPMRAGGVLPLGPKHGG